jgi:hypothetical protein
MSNLEDIRILQRPQASQAVNPQIEEKFRRVRIFVKTVNRSGVEGKKWATTTAVEVDS